jgi:hypothetical protein
LQQFIYRYINTLISHRYRLKQSHKLTRIVKTNGCTQKLILLEYFLIVLGTELVIKT